MNVRIASELEKFLENHNFSISESEMYEDEYGKRAVLTVQQYTPEGEDWYETFELGDGTYKDLIDDIKQRAAYFDIDEEVRIWAESAGRDGTPGFRALVEDAEWKDETLRNLASAIEKKFEKIDTRNTIISDLPLEKLTDSSIIELYDEGQFDNHEPYIDDEFGEISWYLKTEDTEFENSIINKADFDYEKLLEYLEEDYIPENLFDAEYLYPEIILSINADESIELYVMLKKDGELLADKEMSLTQEETEAFRKGIDGYLEEHDIPSVKEYLDQLETNEPKKKAVKEITDD